MKIFNVFLRVTISQIAELPDNPETPPLPKPSFSDDPLKKAEALFDRAERMMAPARPVFPVFAMPGASYPGENGASLTQNVRIQAETYEDLQAILKMFGDTVKAINKVPDSILRDAIPIGTSLG